MHLFLNYVLEKVKTFNIEFHSEHFSQTPCAANAFTGVFWIWRHFRLFIKEEEIDISKIPDVVPDNKQLQFVPRLSAALSPLRFAYNYLKWKKIMFRSK